MRSFTKFKEKRGSYPNLYLIDFIKDYILFPIIAVIFGIATIVMVFFVFPFWLFREDAFKRK